MIAKDEEEGGRGPSVPPISWHIHHGKSNSGAAERDVMFSGGTIQTPKNRELILFRTFGAKDSILCQEPILSWN